MNENPDLQQKLSDEHRSVFSSPANKHCKGKVLTGKKYSIRKIIFNFDEIP